jgi:hypothetical protein
MVTQQHQRTPALTQGDPIPTVFDVPVLDTEARIATWVVAPHNVSDLLPSMWLVCLPGSTYTGLGYFDRQVPGYGPLAYSMARTLALHGIGSIVVDHLGTGASRIAVNGEVLTRSVSADAYQHLVTHIRYRLTHGTLIEGIAPIAEERLFLCGVGHSLGGLLLIHLQGDAPCLDALAVLGYANTNETVEIAGADLDAGLLLALENAQQHHGYLTPEVARLSLSDFFYAPEVPQALKEADAEDATVFPMGLVDTMLPGVVAAHAARIRCPVFLGYGGACDFTMEPRREPMAYPSAASITLDIVPGGYHCTNFGEHRVDLWQHLAAWCRAKAVLARTQTSLPTDS